MNRLSHRLFCSGLAIALILQLVPSGVARAQQTAALSDDQVKERLGYVESALKAGRPRAETWYYGWLGGYSVGAFAGGMLAAAHKNDTKLEGSKTVPDQKFAQDMLVTGATFALGTIALLMDPFGPALATDELRPAPENTAEERRAKLDRAEKMLRDCASREVRGRSLTTHLLNLGANAAAGVVTSAAFHRPWTDGLTTFAIGEAISLLNIFTQPMRAKRDLENYEAKYLRNGTPLPAPPERKWTLSVGPCGLTFRYEF
jgi:hypothetical protein